MRITTKVLAVVLGSTLAWACASSTPSAEVPATEDGQAPGDAPPAEKAPSAVPATWQEGMTKEQQIAYMKDNVIPALTPVFRTHDPVAFAKFGCETCHGPEYKTPTEYLPALTMKEGKLTAFEEEPEMSQWMAGEVVPAMAKAMGMQPYNPETKEGFGCGGCHAIEQG